MHVTGIDIELSDFHNMVCWATKAKHAPPAVKTIKYRSYKRFNDEQFKQDVSSMPFHVSEIFDSVDDRFWFCHKLLTDAIDEHAPIKQRKVKHNQVPYMNNELRRSINVRNMYKRKYYRNRTPENWERYRVFRNKVTSLRKKSIQNYIGDKCSNSQRNAKEYWKTVKPLLSNKCKIGTDHITRMEEGDIVNNKDQVGNIFNNYFVNIASFERCLSEIKTIEYKKSAGHDQVPAKLVKLVANELSHQLCYLINLSINKAEFPSILTRISMSCLHKR